MTGNLLAIDPKLLKRLLYSSIQLGTVSSVQYGKKYILLAVMIIRLPRCNVPIVISSYSYCFRDHYQILELLINARCQIDVKDSEMNTPL